MSAWQRTGISACQVSETPEASLSRLLGTL